MLMIRLQRVGRKNDPSFRVVVVDSKKAAQSGHAIEVLGSHDARHDRTELKAERISYWLSVGAQASDTVHNLLVKKGVKDGKAVDVSSKKLGKKASAIVAAKKAAEEKAVKEAEAKRLEEEKAKAEAEATPEVTEEAAPEVTEVASEEAPIVTETSEDKPAE